MGAQWVPGEVAPGQDREFFQAARSREPTSPLGQTALFEGDRAWWDRNWRSLVDPKTPKTAPDMRVLQEFCA